MSDKMREWAAAPPVVREVVVDRKDIQRFAIATRATNPIHHDPEYARSLGYRDVVAPLLFFVSLRTGAYNQVPQDELHEEGTPLADIPPMSFSQAMAGETDADLHKRFVGGDRVVCSRRITDLTEKQGSKGTITFAHFEYTYSDPDDGVYVVERFKRLFQ